MLNEDLINELLDKYANGDEPKTIHLGVLEDSHVCLCGYLATEDLGGPISDVTCPECARLYLELSCG